MDKTARDNEPARESTIAGAFEENAAGPDSRCGVSMEDTTCSDGSVVNCDERTRTQRALQESEMLFRSLAENLPHLVWITSGDGTVEYCNQRWYEFTGTGRVEEAEAAWRDALHPEDREAMYELWQRCRKTEEVFECEYRFRRASDGAFLWHLDRAVPLRDELGRTVRWFGTGTDIDVRKRAELAQSFMAELHNHFRDLSRPDEILWHTVCALGEHLHLNRCHYAEIDGKRELVVVHRDYCRDVPSMAGTYPLARFGPFVGADGRQGKTIVYDDLTTDSRSREGYETAWAPLQVRAVVAVPVLREGRVVGGLALHSSAPRAWSEAEVQLAEKVMAETWLAMENARLYAAAQEEIAERRRAEARVEERIKEIEAIVNLTPAAIMIAQDPGCIRIVGNEMAHRLLRIPDGAANLSQTAPADELTARCTIWRDGAELNANELPMQYAAANGVEVKNTEIELRFGDGSITHCFGSASPLFDVHGSVRGCVAAFVDVSAEKARSAEIESLNSRLRRSVRETHHRVKNNLQIISAMLDMQTMQHETDVPVSEVERLRQHVSGLSIVHDLLTQQAKQGAEVNSLSVKAALDRLIPMIETTAIGRTLTVDVDDFEIPVGQSTTLAVLVNELVSNAVKHGSGEICVQLSTQAGIARLEVIDNGAGFPENFDAAQSANTGLELVELLSRHDLAGTVRYENADRRGARVVVSFPISSVVRTRGEL